MRPAPDAGGTVSAVAVQESDDSPVLLFFYLPDRMYTLHETPDPENPGGRLWHGQAHGMPMEAKAEQAKRVATLLAARPGWKQIPSSFPEPDGIAGLLQSEPERAGRMLSEAWASAQARVAPAGRRPGQGAPGRPRSVGRPAGPVDRLSAFEQRAHEALALMETDPEAALTEFALLRDEQKEMETSLRRAVSYLDSLESVFTELLTRPAR